MPTDHERLLQTLEARFKAHPRRHEGIAWTAVRARLDASPASLKALAEMERTGGEPDVIRREGRSGPFLFVDCSAESPAGRRSLCYDRKALDARKANKPKGNAMELAATLGVEILSEEEYRHLQTLGEFDRKTSSWILTPPDIRTVGGALFCDRRYDTVFTYHNGAESYYAARGFRAKLPV